MNELTPAQRARLGAFLVGAGVLLLVTLVAVGGRALLEKRDTYTVRFRGSIAGLEPGAQVLYNGVRVGRVERVRIAPDDVGTVEVTLSVEAGTPIREDTVATVAMKGITGLKYIELSGGTQGAKRLHPGGQIRSGGSTMDLLTQRATNIAARLEVLVDNLARMTGGETQARVGRILDEVANLAERLRQFVDDHDEAVAALLRDSDAAVRQARDLLEAAQGDIDHLTEVADRTAAWVRRADLGAVATETRRTLREVRKRLGPDEAGKLIARATALVERSTQFVDDARLTLLRAREDVLRILDAVVEGAEHFAEFAAMLRDNPSVLLRGRSEPGRALP